MPEGKQGEKITLPHEIRELINVGEETDLLQEELRDLTEIANKNDAALLAFLAPYPSKRISPIRERTAEIGLAEEFGIEVAISQINSKIKGKKKLYLLINSPGGLVGSSYQVARTLRRNFDHITVFILREAASGGTLMTMSGNELVMGDMAYITPIDVQLMYKGQWVSAGAMELAIYKLEDYFKDKQPEEAPYPWRVLAEQLDPIQREVWASRMRTVRRYAREILKESGYDSQKIRTIVSYLLFSIYDHSFVIHRDLAEEYGFNIVRSETFNDILDKMRPWLGKHMLKKEGRHIIRYILPSE